MSSSLISECVYLHTNILQISEVIWLFKLLCTQYNLPLFIWIRPLSDYEKSDKHTKTFAQYSIFFTSCIQLTLIFSIFFCWKPTAVKFWRRGSETGCCFSSVDKTGKTHVLNRTALIIAVIWWFTVIRSFVRVKRHLVRNNTSVATLADLPSEPCASDPLMADDDSACSAGQYLCPADPVPEGLLRTPGLPVHRLAGPKQTPDDDSRDDTTLSMSHPYLKIKN